MLSSLSFPRFEKKKKKKRNAPHACMLCVWPMESMSHFAFGGGGFFFASEISDLGSLGFLLVHPHNAYADVIFEIFCFFAEEREKL